MFALCGVASAQTEPPPPPAPPPPPTPEATPPPAPAPPPVAAPAPVAPPEHEMSIHDMDDDRPNELSFAIGVGYERATTGSFDLQMPNIASVRLRLATGLTFEPTITLSNTSETTDPGTGTTSTETITELGLGTLVRYPLIRHRRVDFEIVGSVGVDISKDSPPGGDMDKTTTTFGIGWGIGIGYWLSRHWQLSATATNPLLAFTKQSMETSATETMSTTTTSVGITFAPAISFMIHLYN
ncbi:MAG TPA: hypothetical protein VGG74_36900 [Kofleriaceae bacterium]